MSRSVHPSSLARACLLGLLNRTPRPPLDSKISRPSSSYCPSSPKSSSSSTRGGVEVFRLFLAGSGATSAFTLRTFSFSGAVDMETSFAGAVVFLFEASFSSFSSGTRLLRVRRGTCWLEWVDSKGLRSFFMTSFSTFFPPFVTSPSADRFTAGGGLPLVGTAMDDDCRFITGSEDVVMVEDLMERVGSARVARDRVVGAPAVVVGGAFSSARRAGRRVWRVMTAILSEKG